MYLIHVIVLINLLDNIRESRKNNSDLWILATMVLQDSLIVYNQCMRYETHTIRCRSTDSVLLFLRNPVYGLLWVVRAWIEMIKAYRVRDSLSLPCPHPFGEMVPLSELLHSLSSFKRLGTGTWSTSGLGLGLPYIETFALHGYAMHSPLHHPNRWKEGQSQMPQNDVRIAPHCRLLHHKPTVNEWGVRWIWLLWYGFMDQSFNETSSSFRVKNWTIKLLILAWCLISERCIVPVQKWRNGKKQVTLSLPVKKETATGFF